MIFLHRIKSLSGFIMRFCFLISRSDAAHNASVSSIDAARVHDLQIMVAHGFQKPSDNATVLLGMVTIWSPGKRSRCPDEHTAENTLTHSNRRLVEPSGIEPLTSSSRSRCAQTWSANCGYQRVGRFALVSKPFAKANDLMLAGGRCVRRVKLPARAYRTTSSFTFVTPRSTMPIVSAAEYDKSTDRPAIYGPRSLMRTVTDCPVSMFVTRSRVPNGSVR